MTARGKTEDRRNLDVILEFLREWKPEVKLTLNVNVTGTGAAGLGPVLEALNALGAKVDRMAGELDKLEREVKENSDAIDSAVTLLEGLADLVRANKTDPARLEAIAGDLDRKSQSLAEAVLANTPQVEGPPDSPPPEDSNPSFGKKR